MISVYFSASGRRNQENFLSEPLFKKEFKGNLDLNNPLPAGVQFRRDDAKAGPEGLGPGPGFCL
jgi:hypothetical protein